MNRRSFIGLIALAGCCPKPSTLVGRHITWASKTVNGVEFCSEAYVTGEDYGYWLTDKGPVRKDLVR